MKTFVRYAVVALLASAAVWFFAVPSRFDRAAMVFDAAQVGDSRAIIRSSLGVPSLSETLTSEQKEREKRASVAVCESYSFFLTRFAFYYDGGGKLVDKYKFQSE